MSTRGLMVFIRAMACRKMNNPIARVPRLAQCVATTYNWDQSKSTFDPEKVCHQVGDENLKQNNSRHKSATKPVLSRSVIARMFAEYLESVRNHFDLHGSVPKFDWLHVITLLIEATQLE
eukprot:4459539-Amphidinium_carterae.1